MFLVVRQADKHGLELAGGQENALGEHGVKEFCVGGGVASGGLIEIGDGLRLSGQKMA